MVVCNIQQRLDFINTFLEDANLIHVKSLKGYPRNGYNHYYVSNQKFFQHYHNTAILECILGQALTNSYN